MTPTFIDFCAGIGSTRIALEQVGARCVGFSEIDARAEATYRLFFGEQETNYGDLMQIDPEALPDFDIMLGGFPCQTFSIIGQRAGMEDQRGKVILGLARILQSKKPRFVMLENVKGLLSHNGGKTIADVISLLKSIDYDVDFRLMRSMNFGIPQKRERVFIVGVRSDAGSIKDVFNRIEKQTALRPLTEFLIDRSPERIMNLQSAKGQTFLSYLNNKYNRDRFVLSELLCQDLLVLDTRQSDLRLYTGCVPTLRTGRHGLYYVLNGELRALSGMEALLLQGFPVELASMAGKAVSQTELLAQAGNAMTIPVVQAVASSLLSTCHTSPRRRSSAARSFALAS